MGLDMYAFKTRHEIDGEVDFSVPEGQSEEVFYWRKHPNLHGWMEDLYDKKGGQEEFNCVNVLLTEQDLDELEKDINGNALPETAGFFFGKSYGSQEEKAEDLEFISQARSAIKDGYKVYYTSWW